MSELPAEPMTASMSTSPANDAAAYDEQFVSPELALVDSELAARLRARLPQGRAPFRLVAGAPPLRPDALRPVLPSAGERPTWQSIAALGAAVVVAVGLLLNLESRPGGASRSPSASPSATNEDASADVTRGAPPSTDDVTTTPASGRSGRPPKRASRLQARRFAWAPIDGASAYQVEFFRGSRRVFAGKTTHAQLTLPARWKLEGRPWSLSPGTYRWYVWPIVAGLRSTTAVVRSNLVVH